MANSESPTEPGHTGSGEATPSEAEGTRERELTEYRVPPGKRDEPGARERERRRAPRPGAP
jgi:hypothetical protein